MLTNNYKPVKIYKIGHKVAYQRTRLKKNSKSKILKESVLDKLSLEIKIGELVCYAGKNNELKFGIYEGIRLEFDQFSGKAINYRLVIRVNNSEGNPGTIKKLIIGKVTKTEDDKYHSENLLLVKDLLYHVHIEDVAKCLPIIEKLKDENILK